MLRGRRTNKALSNNISSFRARRTTLIFSSRFLLFASAETARKGEEGGRQEKSQGRKTQQRERKTEGPTDLQMLCGAARDSPTQKTAATSERFFRDHKVQEYLLFFFFSVHCPQFVPRILETKTQFLPSACTSTTVPSSSFAAPVIPAQTELRRQPVSVPRTTPATFAPPTTWAWWRPTPGGRS